MTGRPVKYNQERNGCGTNLILINKKAEVWNKTKLRHKNKNKTIIVRIIKTKV
jgi:hypothetical protein